MFVCVCELRSRENEALERKEDGDSYIFQHYMYRKGERESE